MHPYLVVCDQRRPLDLYRSRRLASADQRIALYGAERGCSRPGCDAPATRTQVHHIVEWRDGGFTNIEYLTLVCDGCHPMLDRATGRWRTDLVDPDGQPVTDDDRDRAGRSDPPDGSPANQDAGPANPDATVGRGAPSRPSNGSSPLDETTSRGDGGIGTVPARRGDTPRPNDDTSASDVTESIDDGPSATPSLEPRRCTTPRVLWKRTGAASYEPLNTRHHPEEELAKYVAEARRRSESGSAADG